MSASSPFVIAQLAPGEEGGYKPRGAARDLWRSRAHECMLSGPAETGKTWACLQKLDALLWKYPGAQAAMLRKTLVSLYPSCFQTYKRIIGADTVHGMGRCPIRLFGGEKPEWADYPNGSRLWFGGMDNPQKALSSERDFIYVNQSEELDVSAWETLTTRATGRGAHAPYTQIFGDCNPGPPGHWIKHRPSLLVLESRHEDNPTLFDEAGNLTEQGRITIGILDGLTGVRKDRLRHGRWVQAEGVVYDTYDARRHLLKRDDLPAGWQQWRRVWGVDFGFTNPFVWQEWAIDPDGRLYLVQEIYLTHLLVEDAAAMIARATANSPKPEFIICDHDGEGRATLERKLSVRTRAAHKAVLEGIQAVTSRLKVADDGRPRLFYVEGGLIHDPDPELVAAKKPTRTAEEIEVYIWNITAGRRQGEEPVKEYDHGQDTQRYVVAELDDIKRAGPRMRFRPL